MWLLLVLQPKHYKEDLQPVLPAMMEENKDGTTNNHASIE